MKNITRCQNMNHGRLNVPVKFCPDCGVLLNASNNAKCDEGKHSAWRKQRLQFCTDCGKKL